MAACPSPLGADPSGREVVGRAGVDEQALPMAIGHAHEKRLLVLGVALLPPGKPREVARS
eukprot:13108805-Heterocapsa_arctica.AAC.1